MRDYCYTRRDVLGGTIGAAALLAGCSETTSSSSSGGFSKTAVEDQQLVVAFEESLDAETISVVDPDGEAFAEASLSAGVTQATFDIEMPYTPGEYRIIATDGEETVAETSQAIQPDLEIVDVGVGANHMDEMPENLGTTQEEEAVVDVKNSGNGPESIQGMWFLGDLPNPKELEGGQIGVLNPETGAEVREPVILSGESEKTLYSSTLPFLFDGDGINCSSKPQKGTLTMEILGKVSGKLSKEYIIEYTAADSYDGCDISLREVS